MGKIGWRLTPSTLSRLERLGLLRDDADIAATRVCPPIQDDPPFPPYDLPPFERNPIRCPTPRKTGWIREFRGPLSVEYRTGFFYKGLRLVRNSWDGLHPPEHNYKTDPLRDWRIRHQYIDEGISLAGIWYGNYHHFLIDFTAKIELVERVGLPLSIPYIITESMTKKRFFTQAWELGLFGSRPVVVHKRRHWLEARRLFTVHPDRFANRADDFIAKRLGARPDPRSRDRLYISRNLSGGVARGIRNEAELIPGLTARGFEIVDPASWPLKEQIERFASASLVAGPHGAGLTNIMFRAGAPLALAEIIPDNKVWRHHLYEVCRHLRFFYVATLGRSTLPSDETAPFDVDVDVTLRAVDAAVDWERRRYAS